MAEPEVLTHAFLGTHPADAARVLERLASADASALFERVPARLGAPVLDAMRAHAAARSLPADTARAALLLAAVSIPAAAAILRYVPEARRRELIDALPASTALATRALLGYPEDAVGAYVDSDVPALPRDATARDALAAIREGGAQSAALVYLVDAARRPVGEVDVTALVRAPAETRLDAMMRPVPMTLSAATPLAAAEEHGAWRAADVVPVVEPGGALVGALARTTLERVHRRRDAAPEVASSTLVAILGASYWHAVASLIEAMVAALPGATRERP